MQYTSFKWFDNFDGVGDMEATPWLAFDQRVQLDHVFLNDTSALRPIEITNLTDHRLRIQFSSSLEAQLALQWTNANVRPGAPLQRENINQIFNTIGHITEFALLPRQQHTLVLVFFPGQGARAGEGPYGPDTPAEAACTTQEVIGKIHFVATRLDQPAEVSS
jgi:hypothetical protein